MGAEGFASVAEQPTRKREVEREESGRRGRKEGGRNQTYNGTHAARRSHFERCPTPPYPSLSAVGRPATVPPAAKVLTPLSLLHPPQHH